MLTVGLCEKSRENNRNVWSDRRETDKILVNDVVLESVAGLEINDRLDRSVAHDNIFIAGH